MSSRQKPTGVWDSNYKGVWHLSELSGIDNAIEDSTSNLNHGTNHSSPNFGSLGQIDSAVRFNDNEDQRIEIFEGA